MMKIQPRKLNWMVNLTIMLLVLAVLYLIFTLFGGFLTRFMSAFNAIFLPFSIALFISYLIAPLFRLLESKLKSKNQLINTILVFTLIVTSLTVFGLVAGGIIYDQALLFIENDWPNILDTFSTFLENNPRLLNTYESFVSFFNLDQLPTTTINFLGIFQTLTNIIITIVLVPVFLFFILNDRTRIYEGLLLLIPKKYRPHAIELTHRAHHVIETYFNGRFLTMAFMAVAFTIAFFILGFGSRSLLFGFMMGFFDIVPYVGPFIAMLLPVLFSLTDDTLLFGDFAPIAVIVMVSVGQLVQNNVAQPIIMGKETKLHPLLVLSSFVFFGYLFGIVGIILAIPLTGTMRSSIEYINEMKQLKSIDEEDKKKIKEAKKEGASSAT